MYVLKNYKFQEVTRLATSE